MYNFKLERTHFSILNPFQDIVAFHIETSHRFCSAKPMTGFYMKCNNVMQMGCFSEEQTSSFVCIIDGAIPTILMLIYVHRN